MTKALLELAEVSAGYGDALVLDGISFTVEKGGSLALLGRNGVGKSTVLLTVMGLSTMRGGQVLFRNRDITRLAPHRRARLGIGWIAQERDIFPSLTVEENLMVASRPGTWTLDAVFALFPRMEERRRHRGNHLSGGEQQMCAIARTLMTNPEILLLDEPLEGLAPKIVEELTAAIRQMRSESGMTLILVEQHAKTALTLSDQVLILERGRCVHLGSSPALLGDAAALEKLLGVRSAAAVTP